MQQIINRILSWFGINTNSSQAINPGQSISTHYAPHEQWSEILHWQKGDEFYVFNWNERCWAGLTLVSLTEDGYAYCDNNGGKVKIPIKALLPYNDSARSREVSEEMKRSGEYMELINQFNIAFNELRERDKRNGIAA